MKKAIVTITTLLIITLLLAFVFKPSENNQRKLIDIDKINLQTFDLYTILERVIGDDPKNANLYFEDFSMTVSDKKNIISLNFSFIEEQSLRNRKTNVHLYSANNKLKLIVKTELLDNIHQLTIKEYIFSLFNIGNSRKISNPLYARSYLHQSELSNLISVLKQAFITDIINEKEMLHIELMRRGYYTIYNDSEIYLVNTITGDITNIEDVSNDNRIKPILENGNIKGYTVENLVGIFTYTSSDGALKYYIVEAN